MFEVQPLGHLIEKHQGGGTPSRSETAFWNGEIPWASVKDFKDGQLELKETEEKVTELGLQSCTSNTIPPFTPLVCTRMAVGRCAVSELPVSINQDVKALYPKQGVDLRYFVRLILSLQEKAESLSVGSTVKGIRITDYLAINTPIAPKNEQKEIAKILVTLDTQIQQTEALVAKLEKVKEGLLHDLLTRGIDENGQLRPSPEQAPEIYKKSPLGLIPRGWQPRTLGEITYGISYGFTNPMPSTSAGPWMLTAADVADGRISYSSARHTSSVAYTKLSPKAKPKIGELLITKDGTLGRVAIVDQEGVCINQSVASCMPRDAEMKSFIFYYLASPLGQEAMLADAGGSTIKHLYISKLSQMYIPIPDAKEAREIADRISSLFNKIDAEKNSYQELVKLKAGLMSDLLTGRVRVTPLLEKDQTATPA